LFGFGCLARSGNRWRVIQAVCTGSDRSEGTLDAVGTERGNLLFELFEFFTVFFFALTFLGLLALSYRVEELNFIFF
jgi:hypothetical protein